MSQLGTGAGSGSPSPRPGGAGRVLVLLGVLALPVLEVFLLIRLGELIGFWGVLGVVLLSMVVGVLLSRREGRRSMQQLRESVARRQPVSEEMAHGALILLGGLALIVPGVLTDLVGLLLLLPPTRALAVRLLRHWTRRRMQRLGIDVDVVRARTDPSNTVPGAVAEDPPGSSEAPGRPRSDPDGGDEGDGVVIRGEVER